MARGGDLRPLKGPQGSPKTRLGTDKGHSIPKVLALREGEERRDRDSQDLCCQRRSKERRETAKVRGSTAKIHNETAGVLERRDRRLGKKRKEEGGKESGRWSRVKEPDGEPEMGTCHSSDKMIEHG